MNQFQRHGKPPRLWQVGARGASVRTSFLFGLLLATLLIGLACVTAPPVRAAGPGAAESLRSHVPAQIAHRRQSKRCKHGQVLTKVGKHRWICRSPRRQARRRSPSYSLRWSVTMHRQFLGGNDGTGSATWRGAGETRLRGNPARPPLTGAAASPFRLTSFTYHDSNQPMNCQDGKWGHIDTEGTYSTPGNFRITALNLGRGRPVPARVRASIRFTAPLDHYINTFYPDESVCDQHSTSSSFRFLDYMRTLLSVQPGVTVNRPANYSPEGETYEISNWRAGPSPVFASRSFHMTGGASGTAPTTVNVVLKLIQHPAK